MSWVRTAVPVGRHITTSVSRSVAGEQQSGIWVVRTIGLHPVDPGEEVLPRSYVFGMENLDDAVSGETEGRFVDFQDDVLVVILFLRVVLGQADAGDALQRLAVILVVLAVDGDKCLHAFQGSQPHRGAGFAHLAVGSQVDHVVQAGEAEVLHQPDLLGHRVVVGDDRPALEAVHELGGVEAEYLRVAEIPDHLPPVTGPQRVGGVVEQFQPSAVGDLLQRLDVAGSPPQVDGDDPGGLRGDQLFDLGGIDGVGDGIDVAEDRGDLLPLQTVGGGDEGEGGDDDLAPHPQRAHGDFEGDGAVAHGDAVPGAGQLGDAPLELPHEGAVVAQPVPVEHFPQPPEEVFPVADIWLADVQGFLEKRLPAEKGKIVDALLVHEITIQASVERVDFCWSRKPLISSGVFHISTSMMDKTRDELVLRAGVFKRRDIPDRQPNVRTLELQGIVDGSTPRRVDVFVVRREPGRSARPSPRAPRRDRAQDPSRRKTGN